MAVIVCVCVVVIGLTLIAIFGMYFGYKYSGGH